MDNLSPEARSRNMSRIRSRDTSPELAVRKYLHRSGLRYRLHGPKLPGKPDLVFPGRGALVLVHGCFWHRCPRCVDGTRRVKSNVPYWSAKVEGNRARDKRNVAALRRTGWSVFTVWECEVKNEQRLARLAKRLKALRLRTTANTKA
jgi:DNA mismatch endonuclease (patch repair protein)